MKTRYLHLGLPFALLLAAGCASQSTQDAGGSAATPSSASSPSSPSRTAAAPAGAPSPSGMRGSASSQPGMAAQPGQPGQRSVYYEFDKSNLSAEDRKLVEAHAEYLRQHPAVKVRVEGNADERGSKEYNLALGQRRAETVTKVMGLLGVNDQRVEAVSYGEEKPKAGGHDEQSWSQNRRSDILY